MFTNIRGFTLNKKFLITKVQRVGDNLIFSFNDKSEVVVNVDAFKENRYEESDDERKRRFIFDMYVEKDGKRFLNDEFSGISVEI